ncbi:BEST3 [Branchiostoma lanceolatum]|uniref:Bestrophin homolog n=1 Tax=Branchiostoma lanceolatum TaxID=7740 RepID=A0A8K0EB55_BRALA|nr:BEST3 [Branchiostoma lanceolatum]
MTTSYSLKVADARFGGFVRLLFRWQASFYKLLYKELLVYLALYSALSATYRLALNDRQREYFEDISLFCNEHTDLIPVAFLLGFYVSVVFTRWWQQYTCIPWPDRIAALIACSVHGEDHRIRDDHVISRKCYVSNGGRLIRRTLVRYVNLATLLIMRSISTAVYKRFPTMNHVVEAGFMMPSELKDYDKLDSPHNKFWLPLNWFCNLVTKCRKEGRVEDPYTFRSLIEESNKIRGCLAMLYSYDWISVPLVYTQVVTVAVYTFFVSCLMGRQWLDPAKQYPGHEVDLYIPIFTILQFLFYMGWLKVAEQLINPFGQDDDDFETNWCIDRNLQISYLAVDDLYMTNPTLERDMYWNQPDPDCLLLLFMVVCCLRQISYLAVDDLYMTNPTLERDMYWNQPDPDCLLLLFMVVCCLRQISYLAVDDLYMTNPTLERDMYWNQPDPDCLLLLFMVVCCLRQISYLAVDDLYMTNPTLERDMYWNQPDPELPYTEASISNRVMTEPFLGSTFDMRLNVQNMEFTNLHTVTEEPEDNPDSSSSDNTPVPAPTIVFTEEEAPGKNTAVPHSSSAPSSPLLSKNAAKSRPRASPRSLRKALLTSKTRAKIEESPLKMKKLDKKRPLSWGGRSGDDSRSAHRDGSVVKSTEENIADITDAQGHVTNRLEVPSSQGWGEESVWTEDEGKPLLQVREPPKTHAEAGVWIASRDTGAQVLEIAFLYKMADRTRRTDITRRTQKIRPEEKNMCCE